MGGVAQAAIGAFDLYKHRRWTLEDGAPPDIWAIAQSNDGYLWLGTGAGLYRFDGVRFERFQPLPGEALAGANIVTLLATRTGDLWMGYHSGGVSLLRAGHLHNFEVSSRAGLITGLVDTGDGRIWAASRGGLGGGLFRFDGTKWHVIDERSGIPTGPVADITLDRDGNLWVPTLDRLFVKPAGQDRFVAIGKPLDGSPAHVVAAPNGGVWLAEVSTGMHYFSLAGSRTAKPVSQSRRASPLLADNLFFDRDGTLWGNLQSGGLFQIRASRTLQPADPVARDASVSTFTTADGLTANQVRPFFQDREGTVWVGTNGGLHRFRLADIIRDTAIPKLAGDPYFGAVDDTGTAYLNSADMLYQLAPDGHTTPVARHLPITMGICAAPGATTWLIAEDGSLHMVRHGRVTAVVPAPGRRAPILGCALDPEGRLWVSVGGIGLLRQKAGSGPPAFEPIARPSYDALMLSSGPTGVLWVVDRAGALTAYDGLTPRRYGADDGLNVGKIHVVLARSTDVLVGGDLGLARFDGRSFRSLRSADYPFLSRITGIVQRGPETWLFGITGLARVDTQALRTAFDRPGTPLARQLFDTRDGLPGSALQDWRSNTLLQSKEGRLWLLTNNGVGTIDPAKLIENPVPPPIVIRALTAGGRLYRDPANLTLPKGVTDIQIDYAALSLAVPEKVRVLYRLEGVDRDWTNPGARRQAFYTNLEPGSYRFQVIAANDSGVWNRRGESVSFAISPIFTQTLAFKLLLILALLIVLWIAYLLRARQLGAIIRMRLEERMGERERIARELHDTLLQGIQGLMLRFQAVANRLPKDNDERRMIDRALDSAEGMIVEGRSSLMGLRRRAPPADLGRHFTEFMRKQSLHSSARSDVRVEGEVRTLMPAVHHEVVRIGEEAAFNAIRHGRSNLIEILIDYGAHEFGIRIRDDGIGIDAATVRHGGAEDHFGLTGMKERAKRIRGKLRILSRSVQGTEVALTLSGAAAYLRQSGWRRAWPW